jgi:LysM repeat protein
MPHTARLNGLRKDRWIDERRDFEKSTRAAIRYLKKLRSKFNSWTLALAAYNCGDNRLVKEMRKQRVSNYYRINLPNETERFVFRITAIKLILENPEKYGYAFPNVREYKPIPGDKVEVRINVRFPIADVAQALAMDFKRLKEMNPHILGYDMPVGRYTVKVPPGRGPVLKQVLKRFASSRRPARREEIKGKVYVVRPGDTLAGISKRTGISVGKLKRLNRLEGSLIKVGQKLRLEP